MSRADLPYERFGEDALISDFAELLTYERDAGFDRAMPEAVLLAPDAAAVRELVEWCRRRGKPVVARGAGTGLSGGALASRGGIVVSLERMRAVEVEPDSRTVRAEAGVPNEEIDAVARRHGLFYPPDPSSGRSSVIGGNIATNAGGPHCFKYGVTANYVRRVEVVLADGRQIALGGLTDSPGYDLRGLVVGSEGTLAIVTAATLELRREPPAVRTLMVSFESLAAAGEAVSAIIAAGLQPAAIEAIDRRGMEVIEAYRQVGLPVEAGAALIVEIDGYPESLGRQTDDLSDLLSARGGTVLRVARTEEERQEIWFARKSAAGALAHLAPSYYLTDITVRRSRLASVLERVLEICDRHDVETASFFHAGDGNLHPLIPCDQSDEAMMERVHRAVEEIIDLCSSEGGSITGEHGVGQEKVPFMHRMYGAAELAAMRDVKLAFDPDGLLNPGKVLPDEIGPIDRADPEPASGDVLRPASAAEAASYLADLEIRGKRVAITGDGTAEPADTTTTLLSTSRLTGIRELAVEDLFVSVGAGTRVAELIRAVTERGLASRLAAPWPESTVGGLLARNLNPPSRMLYGNLRDAVLAVEAVLTDGRILRLGRPLVKDVAGYDLQRLFVGSNGSLGLLTEVTLKLEPRPETTRTVELRLSSWPAARRAAATAIELSLVGAGLVVAWRSSEDGFALRYTAEGLEEDVAAELEAVRRSWERWGEAGEEIETTAVSDWSELLSQAADALLLRVGVPPGRLGEAVGALRGVGSARLLVDWPAALIWTIVPVKDAGRAREVMQALRDEIDSASGYVVAVEAPAGIGEALPPQPAPPGVEIMRRLEERWDPADILRGGWRS